MLTVLVADDEFAVLEVLSMALEGEGHRVLKAGDGADALRILSTQPCDVVVCRRDMPVMNGHQLVDAMKADQKLAAAPGDPDGRVVGPPAPARRGAVVLRKPIRLAELFEHVDRLGKARRQP